MDTFTALPNPALAGTIDDLVERLRLLKIWAGNPSYETIKIRVNTAWSTAGRPANELAIRSTVAHCFQPGRQRLNTDLVLAIVEALRPDVGYVNQWRQAMRVVGGEAEAVSQARVQGTLPPDLAGFTGRLSELDRLGRATQAGDAVVVSALEGMAGVGKTQLAIHAGHLLLQQHKFDRVLFVNLRGFDPDPAQPPVDPAAVLDGFLRLLGVPGHRVPHDPAARAAAFRDRLSGMRTLILLDNAATVEQVRPLLPDTPGSLALITSRRSLSGLRPATQLTVGLFDHAEAITFLADALPCVPIGSDPDAPARIARRCGHLPLALSLIAGHIRNTTGWTLTDHADRLDEHHEQQRLDIRVELAFDLSYQHLPAKRQRLLRLAALHPGQDFDAYAAAAMTDVDLTAATAELNHLCDDHLLQRAAEGRYTFHDLIRGYAAARARDHDAPSERRAALTQLFDHYLVAVSTATTISYSGEDPQLPLGTCQPDLTEPDTALAWLNSARPTLIAVIAHAATHGWPRHTIQLAAFLSYYLSSGHQSDAIVVQRHALDMALDAGDTAEQAQALMQLGVAHRWLGRPDLADKYLQQALELSRRIGDPAAQSLTLNHLGGVAEKAGRRPDVLVDYQQQALTWSRRAGDRALEALALSSLGSALQRAGRLPEAEDCIQKAVQLARHSTQRTLEPNAVGSLGNLNLQLGRYAEAGNHLRRALSMYRQLSHRTGQAQALDRLGRLHSRLGQFDAATD